MMKKTGFAGLAAVLISIGCWGISSSAGAVELNPSSLYSDLFSHLAWTQLVETRSCSVVRGEPCPGQYRMTLYSDGYYRIFQPEENRPIQGWIPRAEIQEVNLAVDGLDGRGIINERPQCELASEGPGKYESIQLSFRDHRTITVFASGTENVSFLRATCYLGGKQNSLHLKSVLTRIFNEHSS